MYLHALNKYNYDILRTLCFHVAVTDRSTIKFSLRVSGSHFFHWRTPFFTIFRMWHMVGALIGIFLGV